jgi:hypothetical protein
LARCYSFSNLKKHTSAIRADSRCVFNINIEKIEEAFLFFDNFFKTIEQEEISLARNVKLVMATRFINHVYSALLLTESGMTADASICERSAIEVLAAYKLVNIDMEMLEKYETEQFPKPVKVREMLEKLGYKSEAEQIQQIYTSLSGITHISRKHERFSLSSEKLMIGGCFDKKDVEHLSEFLPFLLYWFAQKPISDKPPHHH